VVAVTLPVPGDAVTAGAACGDIESVKSVSDLIAPVTGTVRARSDVLAGAPELVNPFGQGWMFELGTGPATLAQQLAGLLDAGNPVGTDMHCRGSISWLDGMDYFERNIQ
jgi:glycine cleavage system H protein